MYVSVEPAAPLPPVLSILTIPTPSSPGCPFKPLNAKLKPIFEGVPAVVTLTNGVPVVASTLAVTPVIYALVPGSPCGPLTFPTFFHSVPFQTQRSSPII